MKMIDGFNGGLSAAGVREIVPEPPFASGVPRRWRWHYETLLKMREHLLRHRLQLAEQAAASADSLDSADAATDDFEHDLALAQLSSEQDVLYEILGALSRIRNGTYGVCELTGQPIPAARLRAVPWTRFSYAAEEQLENAGTFRPPHLGELRSIHQPVTRAFDAELLDEGEEVL